LVEEEGEGRGFCMVVRRAPLPPSIQTENDKGPISGKILLWDLIRYAGEALWSVCNGRKRKRKEFARVMVCMAEFKIQI
jgi:hypothetical protein